MELSTFKNRMDDDWLDNLKPFLESKEMDFIFEQIKQTKGEIWPKSDDCFNAFKYCKWKDVKVVIIGQDPYHDPNTAHGLAFSSNKPFYCPPSLSNILREIEDDIYKGLKLDGDYNLKRWAEQGVLLLNTALTVEEGKPGSHIGIWKPFTEYVFQVLKKKSNIVYMLWGNYAKQYSRYINNNNNLVLTTGHPSPLSANRGYWFKNKHFSKCNNFLKNQQKNEIKW